MLGRALPGGGAPTAGGGGCGRRGGCFPAAVRIWCGAVRACVLLFEPCSSSRSSARAESSCADIAAYCVPCIRPVRPAAAFAIAVAATATRAAGCECSRRRPAPPGAGAAF